MSGKTSSKSKNEYNKREYTQYNIRIRKDSGLDAQIAEFTRHRGISFNRLVTDLLEDLFGTPTPWLILWRDRHSYDDDYE